MPRPARFTGARHPAQRWQEGRSSSRVGRAGTRPDGHDVRRAPSPKPQPIRHPGRWGPRFAVVAVTARGGSGGVRRGRRGIRGRRGTARQVGEEATADRPRHPDLTLLPRRHQPLRRSRRRRHVVPAGAGRPRRDGRRLLRCGPWGGRWVRSDGRDRPGPRSRAADPPRSGSRSVRPDRRRGPAPHPPPSTGPASSSTASAAPGHGRGARGDDGVEQRQHSQDAPNPPCI